MKLLLCKLCEYATQQQNGRHSMIGLFDNIVAPLFPVDHPPMFLCLQFEFDPSEAGEPMDVTIKLIDSDAKPLIDFTASGEIPRDVDGGRIRLFMQFHVPPVRLERPGDYRLDVQFNGKLVGEELLPVLKS